MIGFGDTAWARLHGACRFGGHDNIDMMSATNDGYRPQPRSDWRRHRLRYNTDDALAAEMIRLADTTATANPGLDFSIASLGQVESLTRQPNTTGSELYRLGAYL